MFAAVFVLSILIIPQSSRAITAKDLKAQIEALKAQIEQLSRQLAEAEQEPQEWCYNFKKNLKIGDRGDDVDALQLALGKEGFDVSGIRDGNNIGVNEEDADDEEEDIDDDDENIDADKSGYFDEETASAVVAFQEKYADEILKPYRLKRGTGFVGKTTRAKLNSLYGCGRKHVPPKPSPKPSIESGIVVNSPDYNEIVSSPLKIFGYINGNDGWSGFEGQVGTVELLDGNNNRLSSAILEATTDWMKLPTKFSTVLSFAQPSTLNGTLVFHNENPKGDNLKTYKIPVRFKKVSSQPSITLLSPNGGEVIVQGIGTTISWKADNVSLNDAVYLVLSDESSISGSTDKILVNGNCDNIYHSKTGNFFWDGKTICSPGGYKSIISTGKFRIRAQLRSGTDSNKIIADDESDAPFSIASSTQPSITLLSPNGGESWTKGTTQTIRWSSANVSTVMVDLVRPNYECHLTNGDIPNVGFLTYSISNCVNGLSILPANDYKIRVMYRSNASIITEDTSDSPFSIVASGGATSLKNTKLDQMASTLNSIQDAIRKLRKSVR